MKKYLTRARVSKNDEFYTRLEDIEDELKHFDLLKQADLDEIIKEPVLITEEVLLKCGFEVKPDSSLPTFAYSRRLDLQVEFMLGEYSFRIEV